MFVLTARRGRYSDGGPARALDFQEPYLRSILGFIGLDDVTFAPFEGIAMGPDEVAKGFERARAVRTTAR